MNNIHSTAIIYDNVTLGDNITIGAYAVIGSPPEHKEALKKGEWKGVHIEDNVYIADHATISAGVKGDTIIYEGCFIQKGAYIGHDCILLDNVTISANASIGGDCIIGSDSNVGMGAMLHQGARIGYGCMIGMGAVVTKTLITEHYGVYVGNPARFLKTNQFLIDKQNVK